ncbi:hypothetical protein PMAYCL1PPCAC_33126 [Pristionchus mayeri]|uniref:Uncharacterized protein n=1 Tax=Pristionchus mayeri TaxID=1317129 RepID=A0AAN5DG64_9BILA|nr:hypothetical protein PMAYCL1PPCAC_33126 [Pristionchus mayeri]
MRLPHNFWNTLLLSIVCTIIYLLLRSSYSQTSVPLKSVQLYNNETKINISILGQDDGSRRKKDVKKKDDNSMSCNIPKLEINGSDVVQFFHAPKPINCNKGENWVYIDRDNKIQLIEERKDAKCHTQSIIFDTDAHNNMGPQEPLQVGKELPSEMVNVRCSQGGKTWELPLISLQKVKKETKTSEKKRWSVLMMSFDSVSQMTFRRKLPKTAKFLEEELGTVVLNGYNIVGDGTPQAFIPILTGATEEELPLTRKRFPTASYVDDVYPFIWNNFSQAGYVTMFAEDQAYLGMMNYRLKGFKRSPTDHYARPYFKQLEGRHGNTNAQCVGSDIQHKHWLRYARKFLEAYQDQPRFGLMHHCVYSHDDINLIGLIDDDFSFWLQSISDDGLLDDTILIVMADHGHRFAKLRETHQGQLEERLPFYSFALPKDLRATEEGEKMYKNLKMNKDRLSSPFDIHQTLHDILDFPADLTTEQSVKSRSLSLLRPIPQSRNCDQAGIAPHWCTCLDWKDAMTTQEDKRLSTQIAGAIVEAFNEQLRDEFKICSRLELKGIEYAKKLIPKDDLLKYKNVKDKDGFVADLSGKTKAAHAHYQVKLSTAPGRGVYEVTVLFDFVTRHLTLDLASVSHVSRYGDDPHCIIDRNYFLATYCVCYDKIGATQ